MFLYVKVLPFLVKRLNVAAKCCLKFDIPFHDDVYCCVTYSNVEFPHEIFKNYSLKLMLKSKRLELVLDIIFMKLNILNSIFPTFLDIFIQV